MSGLQNPALTISREFVAVEAEEPPTPLPCRVAAPKITSV